MKSEQKVHIVDSLTGSAFQQIVDNRHDEQFAVFLCQIEQTLVGVDNILQIRNTVDNEGKIVVGIVFFIQLFDFIKFHRTVHIDGRIDAAREAASDGNEIDFAVEAVLQRTERLTDFCQVLMLERLVNRHVVVAPGEMGRSRRLHSGTGTARNGRYMNVAVEQQILRQRQQCQLYSSGETARSKS